MKKIVCFLILMIGFFSTSNFQKVEAKDIPLNFANISITAPSLTVCIGAPYQTLGNIILTETAFDDFKNGNGQNLILRMPANYQLNPGVGSVNTLGGGMSNVSITVTGNDITVTFDANAASETGTNVMIIGGLQVRAVTGAAASANISRDGASTDLTSFAGSPNFANLARNTQPSAPTGLTGGSITSFCQGQNIAASTVTATGIGGGNTVKWYPNPSLTGPPLATGATVNVTALGINTTNPSMTNVYVTQTTAAGCESVAFTVSFSVNPQPTAFLSSNKGQNTIAFCTGTSVTFTAFPTGAGYSYNFKKNNVSVQNSAANTYTSSTFTTGDVITVEVRDVSSNCISMPSNGITADVKTVNVEFVAPASTTYTTASSAVDLSNYTTYGGKVNGTFADAATGTYSGPGVSNGRFYPALAGIGGPYTITYSYTSPDGCTGQATIAFDVIDPTSPIQNLNAAYCVGDVQTNVTLSAAFLANYPNAYIEGTGITPAGGTGPWTFTTAGLGNTTQTIVVKNEFNFGFGSIILVIATKSVFISNLPNLDFEESSGVSFKSIYCKNNPSLLLKGRVDGLVTASGTFEKKFTSSGSYSILAGNTIDFSTLPPGIHYIRYTFSYAASPNCSNSIEKFFIVPTLPVPNVTGANNSCLNDVKTYTTPNNVGSSYSWSVSNGVITGFYGNSIDVRWNTLAGPFSVSVTETNASGCGVTNTRTGILVNPLPNPGISGSSSVCANGTDNYSIANTPGNSYLWTVSGGTITSANNTPNITVDWGSGTLGSVSVTETINSTSCSKLASVLITINPLPTSSISGSSTVCANTTAFYSVLFNLGRTYSWNVTGGTITGGAGTNSITVNWGAGSTGSVNVTETITASSCNQSVSLPITINPLPNSVISGSASVCQNEVGVSYSVPNIVGRTYSWFVTGGTITSVSNTNAITVNWGIGTTGTVNVIEMITATGCAKTAIRNITINPLPLPFIGNNLAVCENTGGQIYTTASVVGHTYLWSISGGTITGGAGTNSVTVTWGNAGIGIISVLQTNTTTGCQGTTTNNITLHTVPNPVITGLTTVCKSQTTTYSTPLFGGRSYSWSITGGIITSASNTNAVTVIWTVQGAGNLSLTETNTSTTPNCPSIVNLPVTVNPSPDDLAFTVANTCLGDISQFTATATGITGAWTWEWNFGDGTVSILQNPLKKYVNTGNYTVILKATNEFGCAFSVNQLITINPVPIAQFLVSGACNGTPIQFNDLSTVANPGVINFWTWDFGDGTILSGSNPLIHKNPTHIYPSIGVYTVKLTVMAGACQDIITKKTAIFPSISVLPDSPYQQGFSAGASGWIESGVNPSWELGNVNKNKIKNSTGNAWVTKLAGDYNDDEKSYVESPCFNLSALDKPMISLRIWSDTDETADGAVLLITDDDGLNWQVLGSINQGVEWYNKTGILGNPGVQSPAQSSWTGSIVGWAGNTQTDWVDAKFSLDAFKGETVRFRISFGSNSDDPVGRTFDGFAFDDVFIGNRNRVVLIEHFTNIASTDANTESAFVYNFNTIHSNETVFIEHHTNFPGEDALNKDNTADPSARALFYGVSQTSRASTDGYIENKSFSAWAENYYSKRTLAISPFKIDISIPTTPTTLIDVKADITALGTVTNPVVVQIVVIEKQITLGGVVYKNVLKKILPNAAGNLLTNTWTLGTQRSITQSWNVEKVYDLNNLAIVVYIQDDKTKEIYQTAMYSLTTPPTANSSTLITGIADEGLDDQIVIYPNPASDELNIDLVNPLNTDCILRVYNMNGQMVLTSTIKAGEKTGILNTSGLAEGVYVLEFTNEKTKSTVRKSLVIKHK